MPTCSSLVCLQADKHRRGTSASWRAGPLPALVMAPWRRRLPVLCFDHGDIDTVLVHIQTDKENARLFHGSSPLPDKCLAHLLMARRGCVRAIHDSPGDGPPQVKPFCLGLHDVSEHVLRRSRRVRSVCWIVHRPPCARFAGCRDSFN
jgi:hypothetical protein